MYVTRQSTSTVNRPIHVSRLGRRFMMQYNAPRWAAIFFSSAILLAAMSDGTHAADAMPSTAPSSSQTQFGGQCAEALAEGRHVMTDCKSTWTDKDGKIYCFSSDAAKKSFLEKPTENLQRAQAFMAASSVESTEQAMQDFSGTDAEALVKELIADK